MNVLAWLMASNATISAFMPATFLTKKSFATSKVLLSHSRPYGFWMACSASSVMIYSSTSFLTKFLKEPRTSFPIFLILLSSLIASSIFIKSYPP